MADASGSDQEVWSPVCYPEDETLRQQLAKLACEQFHYYPWARTTPWYMMPKPGPVAFPIPQGEGWRWGRGECFQACLPVPAVSTTVNISYMTCVHLHSSRLGMLQTCPITVLLTGVHWPLGQSVRSKRRLHRPHAFMRLWPRPTVQGRARCVMHTVPNFIPARTPLVRL